MDLNEKLAQRRKERQKESAAVQAAQVSKEMVRTEHIKQEARKQLEEGGLQIGIYAEAKKDIQVEKEKMLQEAAKSRWTTAENGFLLVLFGLTIAAFFKSWMFGVLMIVVILIYTGHITNVHKKEIEDEMTQFKLRDALREHMGTNKM